MNHNDNDKVDTKSIIRYVSCTYQTAEDNAPEFDRMDEGWEEEVLFPNEDLQEEDQGDDYEEMPKEPTFSEMTNSLATLKDYFLHQPADSAVQKALSVLRKAARHQRMSYSKMGKITDYFNKVN